MPASLFESIPREMLVHAGFLLVAAAFLVRDVLWLRLLAIAAYTFFVAVALTAKSGPAWEFLIWYTAFMAINAGHAAWLIHERRLEYLSADERRLFDLAFPALEIIPVKRLMRLGRWMTLSPEAPLTQEGEISENVYVVFDGSARIEVAGSHIADVGPGQFIGEIGLIASRAATATAMAGENGVKVLAWRQRDLRRKMNRLPDLRATVHAAMGQDLARKIAEHTVKLTRPRSNPPALQSETPEDKQLA